MRSRTIKEGSVGLLIIASVLVFGGFVLWIKGFAFGKKSYAITTNFPDVNGIQVGDGVRYRGLNVGRINDIQPGTNGVMVELEIDSVDLLIPKDATVKARSSGLIGETFIDIVPETDLAKDTTNMSPLAANCDSAKILCDRASLEGEKALTIDDLLPFTYRFSKAYGEPEFVEKVDLAVANASIAAGEVANLTRDTSALINDLKQEIAGISDATAAITKVADSTSSELVTTAKTYQETAEQISRLANNVEKLIDQNEASLATTLTSIETTSDHLQGLVTKIDTTVEATDTKKLASNLEELTINAAAASQDLKSISATFSTDESLVSLQQTLDSARVTFDNAQKITADLESITGDPAFLDNVRELINGLSDLVSTTEALEQQIQVSKATKPIDKAFRDSLDVPKGTFEQTK